jgi:hypothetical protein
MAEQLKRDAASAGLSVYLYEEEMAVDEQITAGVMVALRQAACFVVVLSKKSVKNAWIHYEIGLARALGKPVLVFQKEQFSPPVYLKDSYLSRRVEEIMRALQTKAAEGLFVNSRNMSRLGHHPIFQAAAQIGLATVEFRQPNVVSKTMPPMEVFNSAKREVVMIAISAYRTFDQYWLDIHRLVARGVRFCAIIEDPKSPGMCLLEQSQSGHLVSKDIEQVIAKVRGSELVRAENFELRLHSGRLNYTGILIDGDIVEVGASGNMDGYVRVQPAFHNGIQHTGLVIELHEQTSQGAYSAYRQDFKFFRDSGSIDASLLIAG